jgi:phage terminase small subunit
MGEINLFNELLVDNPKINQMTLRVFADTLGVYAEASKNVREKGAIVLHPRTGAPIENPYLKIQSANGILLAKMKVINSSRVLKMLGLA